MDFANHLKESGYRITNAREVICTILENSGHKHFTVEELHSEALKKDKNIIGGKIIGAGGGGFFLLVTKNLKKTILKFKRQKLNFSRLEIGKVGSQIIST